jgi:hypothetical protein
MMVIKELQTDFIGKGQVRGFKFTQISKTNTAFLYEINTGDMIYYEVFRKRINRRYGCESYPTDKAFGIWAWTTSNLNRAYWILLEEIPKRIVATDSNSDIVFEDVTIPLPNNKSQ